MSKQQKITPEATPESVEMEKEYWKSRCAAAERLHILHLRNPESDECDKAFDKWIEISKQEKDIAGAKWAGQATPVDGQVKKLLIEHLLNSSDGDKPYLGSGGVVYSKNQLAEEIDNDTKVGLSTIENVVALCLEMLAKKSTQETPVKKDMKFVLQLIESEIIRYRKSTESLGVIYRATANEKSLSDLLRDEEYLSQFECAKKVLAATPAIDKSNEAELK